MFCHFVPRRCAICQADNFLTLDTLTVRREVNTIPHFLRVAWETESWEYIEAR